MKIGNPRNIPKDIRILVTSDGKEWFEGGLWTKPAKMPQGEELALIDKGFLVADGG